MASDGTHGNSNSHNATISSDGRYVAFESTANNLVISDTNGYDDIFVHDRQTGHTLRASVASDGTQANNAGNLPSISANGQYVTFFSTANNLVISDTNGASDVFIHDTETGRTKRVSVTSDGTQGNSSSYNASISADGQYVAFESWANNLVISDTNSAYDVFVHNTQTGQTQRVSLASDGKQGNYQSHYPSISADGRYVAFESYATNLVISDTNYHYDIFVHNIQTRQTSRVSVASDGTQADGDSSLPPSQLMDDM